MTNPLDYLPNDDHFCRRETAGTPLLAAVDALALRTGRTLDHMELLTLGEIAELAIDHYGANLPEFWRIWIDWNQHGQAQPMGDL
jgi:hypothetical protein